MISYDLRLVHRRDILLQQVKRRKIHNQPDHTSWVKGVVIPTIGIQPTTMVFVKDDAKVVGYAYARDLDLGTRLIRHYDCGCFIQPEYRENGYGTKALRKLVSQLEVPRHRTKKIRIFAGVRAAKILRRFHRKRLLVSVLDLG